MEVRRQKSDRKMQHNIEVQKRNLLTLKDPHVLTVNRGSTEK